MPGLRVTSGALKQGDKVTITIGDTTRNGPGYRVMTRDSDDYPFWVSADFNGDGTVVPVARISTVVSGDDAAFINAVAPSVVGAGEAFSVRLRVEDQYWNPARDGQGAFKVRMTDWLGAKAVANPGVFRALLRDWVIANPGRALELLPEWNAMTEFLRT